LDRKKSFIESTTKALVYTFICRFVKHVLLWFAINSKKNHDVEHPYLEAVIKEWSFTNYLTKTHYQRNSFRGGTPLFFSPKI
jgi:oxygen-independent coproporphyrinogen-3 oxidase